MEKIQTFGEYLQQLRDYKNITMEQLCDGLCDEGAISRLEQSKRDSDWLLQERLLSRLGVSIENHENYLYFDDYEHWKKREDILWAIMKEDLQLAHRLLEDYSQTYNIKKSLNRQFYLAMMAQIKRQENVDGRELEKLFREALLLTVPKEKESSIFQKVLAIEEINLYLEFLHYNNDTSEKEYYELLSYIEKTQETELSKAKLYPKAVYYLYMYWEKYMVKTPMKAKEMLVLCDKAIELLRNTARMFYLWELLEAKRKLLLCIYREDKAAFESQYKECAEWKKVLEAVYKEYDITIEMKHFCYLYIGAENYRVGDVIRIRRKMLGLTMKELAEGICTERTVSRLEQNKIRTQREYVEKMLLKLNLSPVSYRSEIMSNNHEVREKYGLLKVVLAQQDVENGKTILKQLKQSVDMDNSINQQVLLINETFLKDTIEPMRTEKYWEQIKCALDITIAYDKAISEGEKYFTNAELICLRNMAQRMENENRQVINDTLASLCDRSVYHSRLRISDYVWEWVASETGNAGEYDSSNEMEFIRLETALLYRRAHMLHTALSAVFWNNTEKKKEQGGSICISDCREQLQGCITLSSLCRNHVRMNMYKEVLEKEYS